MKAPLHRNPARPSGLQGVLPEGDTPHEVGPGPSRSWLCSWAHCPLGTRARNWALAARATVLPPGLVLGDGAGCSEVGSVPREHPTGA